MTALDLPARILETVPRPVWVVDGEGAVAFVNPAAARELRYRHPDDLRGRPSHDTLHSRRLDGSAYPAAECPLLRPVRTGEPAAAADQWLFRRDGEPFPVAWSSVPIELPDGQGVVLTFTDVTDRREQEAAAREREWAQARADSPRRSALADRATLTATIWTFVAENATDPHLTPAVLARQHHVSLRFLQSLFSDSGHTPASYIRDQRLTRAKALLRRGETVTRSALLSGFTDAGTLTRAFRRRYGTTPSEFRAGGFLDVAREP
ncbi:helix-turn-helix transcriptional regulator [Actinophytocola sp.]|uniref:helix-turn-helix transcriptional regulator n=1 Tax=Actinophytocola sp. TaxID=1872138 RepID=UPI002ED83C51